jgi:hypothetical protein
MFRAGGQPERNSDGLIDMTKRIVAFSKFTNVHTKEPHM